MSRLKSFDVSTRVTVAGRSIASAARPLVALELQLEGSAGAGGSPRAETLELDRADVKRLLGELDKVEAGLQRVESEGRR